MVPRNNITNSLFRFINSTWLIRKRTIPPSTGNKFIDVGNEGGGDTTPFPIAKTRRGSELDDFERKRRLMYDAGYTSILHKSETEGEIDLIDNTTLIPTLLQQEVI